MKPLRTSERRYETVNVGDDFSFAKPPVTTKQLVMYAGASGDYNRIHYDYHFALEAGLGGVIQHGMLTMGFLAQAVTDWAGPGSLVRNVRSRFVSPVRLDDIVTIKGSVQSKDSETEATCSLSLEGFVEDRRVIVGSAVVALSHA